MPDQFAWLRAVAAQERLDWAEALRFIQRDAILLMDRMSKLVCADGRVDVDKERRFNDLRAALGIPDDATRHLLDTIARLKDPRWAPLERFRQAFVKLVSEGDLTTAQLSWLRQLAAHERIHWAGAAHSVQQDVLTLLERILASIAADGVITDDEEQHFNEVRYAFGIRDDLAQSFLEKLARIKALSVIRGGKLPTVQPAHILDSDEICHFDAAAVYLRTTTSRVIETPGRLLATNKKIYWIAPTGGAQHSWSTVMGVGSRFGGFLVLELTKKAGTGSYRVPDVELAEALFSTVVRMEKRQTFSGSDASDDRRIPPEVKRTVWQRDQGKCVECGAHGKGAWLEYDHIIPHAKGGANTVGNIQLLCRGCNLKKGDRI